MSVSYTCPNPDCRVTLKTPNRVPAGKRVKCPKCGQLFAPEPEEKPAVAAASKGAAEAPAAGGTFKFADDPKKPAGPKAEGQKKPEEQKKAEEPKKEPEKKKKPFEEEDEDPESVKRGYGVVKETEQELAEAEKNKPKFGAVQDKFKKSARGPATALLVTPANLLTAEGLITGVGGVVLFVLGMWPLVFNDAPPGDEEVDEAIVTMMLGAMTLGWGAFICFGASQMSDLNSYMWSMAGAVMGILPLLVGIYAVIMLLNPKVKEGFEEGEAGAEEDDEDDKKKDEDDDEDDEDEDD